MSHAFDEAVSNAISKEWQEQRRQERLKLFRDKKKLGTKQKYLFWKQEERKAKEQLNNSSTQ